MAKPESFKPAAARKLLASTSYRNGTPWFDSKSEEAVHSNADSSPAPRVVVAAVAMATAALAQPGSIFKMSCQGRRARKGKDRGERPNSADKRVAGARQWASLARVPVGALRGSLAPDFFMRCPPYDPILVSGMTHRFPGVRVALRVVHLGPFIEFEGRKSCCKNSTLEFWIFRGRIHRVSVTSTPTAHLEPRIVPSSRKSSRQSLRQSSRRTISTLEPLHPEYVELMRA